MTSRTERPSGHRDRFTIGLALVVVGGVALTAHLVSLRLLDAAVIRDRLPDIYSPSWLGNALAIVAMLFLVAGLAGAYWLFRHPDTRLRNPLLVIWTIAPPLYFVAPGSETHYWASQRLYVPLWAGIGALLGLIATDRLRRPASGRP